MPNVKDQCLCAPNLGYVKAPILYARTDAFPPIPPSPRSPKPVYIVPRTPTRSETRHPSLLDHDAMIGSTRPTTSPTGPRPLLVQQDPRRRADCYQTPPPSSCTPVTRSPVPPSSCTPVTRSRAPPSSCTPVTRSRAPPSSCTPVTRSPALPTRYIRPKVDASPSIKPRIIPHLLRLYDHDLPPQTPDISNRSPMSYESHRFACMSKIGFPSASKCVQACKIVQRPTCGIQSTLSIHMPPDDRGPPSSIQMPTDRGPPSSRHMPPDKGPSSAGIVGHAPDCFVQRPTVGFVPSKPAAVIDTPKTPLMSPHGVKVVTPLTSPRADPNIRFYVKLENGTKMYPAFSFAGSDPVPGFTPSGTATPESQY